MLDGYGIIGRRCLSQICGVQQVLMGYVSITSFLRSSLNDGLYHAITRRMKRGLSTWYQSTVPGTTPITTLCGTRFRTAVMGPHRTIRKDSLKQIKMAGPFGWFCSSGMKEPTQKTVISFYLTKLYHCTHGNACSTRTSTPFCLPNILQAYKQHLWQSQSIKTKSNMRIWCRN